MLVWISTSRWLGGPSALPWGARREGAFEASLLRLTLQPARALACPSPGLKAVQLAGWPESKWGSRSGFCFCSTSVDLQVQPHVQRQT